MEFYMTKESLSLLALKPRIEVIAIFSLIFFYVFSIPVFGQSRDLDTCLEFTSPLPWIAINDNICTLSIKPCSLIQAVSFKVKYFAKNDSLPLTQSLGNITRSPFKFIWNLNDVPNQLYYGATCFAEARLRNKQKKIIEQQGIFLTHNPIKRNKYRISYSTNNEFNNNSQSLTLTSPFISAKALINISWYERSLLFHVKVQNSFFYNTLPKDILRNIGFKVSLDLLDKRKPYISEEILTYMIPVTEQPYQIIARSNYNPDGSFNIKKTHNPISLKSSVQIENFKGYTVDLAVTNKLIGKTLPQIVGCNLTVSVINEHSEVKEISWIQGNQNIVNSPFSYGELKLIQKPFLANPFLLWFISFFVGILVGLGGIAIFRMTQKYNPLKKFENSEEEKQAIKNIDIILEAEITNTNFSINEIASKLKLTPKKINSLVKRYYNKSFTKHLLFCRVEIAKERLRSSNASESSIAKSCGFSSVSQMEKQFQSFVGITPYTYREKYRIT